MPPWISRVQLLLAQQRYELAEKELRRVLGEQPDEALAYAFLALCLVQGTERYQEASDAAARAIQMEPDAPFHYYAMSLVSFRRNMYKEALEQINESIRLDPYDADYFGLQANIYFQLRQWQQALDAAETGLGIDPDHTLSNNLRSLALERLGRGDDAVEASRRSVQRDPDDSYSHATLGWTLLERGRHHEAQESFREALRLDPNNEMARGGMIQAINSGNFLYRIMERWHTTLSRFALKYQFGILIGAWLLVTMLGQVGDQIPWVAPLVPFILMAYMVFAVLTWTSHAIFNSLLRFHPFGKHLLDRKQIWTSNCVAACIVSGAVGGVYALATVGLLAAIVVVFYWMLMCVPATLPFSMPTRQRAWLAGAAGIAIGLIPVFGIVVANADGTLTPFVGSLRTFNWSIIGLQIIGGVMAVRPHRL